MEGRMIKRVLAFVLGSIIESSTRRSLLIFGGDPTGFVTRPISAALIVVTLLVVLAPLFARLFRRPIVIQ